MIVLYPPLDSASLHRSSTPRLRLEERAGKCGMTYKNNITARR